jgi:hypothetical protein
MATARRSSNQRSIDYAACSLGVDYFIHHFCFLDEPQGEDLTILPFHLWPAQRKLLARFQQHRQHIILKARQLGISWLVCAYVLWLCVFQPGRVVILFSKGQLEADELLRRVLVMYQRLPDWMRATNPLTTQNTSELIWSNGSTVKSLPATKNAGRSFTASLVVVDEFAYLQWPQELYTALKPTIDGGGRFIMLSTANGKNNLFYDLWTLASERKTNLLPSFLSWRARPGRTDAWRDSVASDATLVASIDQEYPSVPEDAFNNTGSKPFLESMILWDACRADLPPLKRNEPLVLAADAGYKHDYFALVGVSGCPGQRGKLAVRYVRVWRPQRNQQVQFSEVETEIRRMCKQYAVTVLTYDGHQMAQMAQRLLNDGVVMVEEFNQGPRREKADKGLYDLILSRLLAHDGNADLKEAVANADRKITEDRKLRLVKRTDSLHIDAAVSLSMACDEALKLGLDQ